ncbi:HdeD family acid-resistance protein [Streptomyces sp. NPDC058691]|uniref:HdeD family acid-resistance protein n=1 Tax=Streptomyces sp. NPDC058691 TaxID=3346601 RepID=UPI003669FC8D
MLSSSDALLCRSLLTVAVGVVAEAWPGITIGAFVALFAVYAFMGAALDIARAFSSGRLGPVHGRLMLALLSVVAGAVASAWPAITALAVTMWLGAWALGTGAMEIALAFPRGELPGERVLFVLTGLMSVALAFVFFAQPDMGAVSLATTFGLFCIFHGTAGTVASLQERSLVNDIGGAQSARS